MLIVVMNWMGGCTIKMPVEGQYEMVVGAQRSTTYQLSPTRPSL